jgi:hypothetical protein
VLGVVDREQVRPLPDGRGRPLERGPTRLRHRAQRSGEGGRDQGGVGQVHERCPAAVVGRQAAQVLQREARLAGAARAGQRDEAVRRQVGGDRGEQVGPPDEGRQRERQRHGRTVVDGRVRRTGRRRGWPRRPGRRTGQQLVLERDQLRPRIDPEVLAQATARAPHRVQRLDLPPGSRQRRGQQADRPLAQGVPLDQLQQTVDQRRVLAQVEPDRGLLLEGSPAQLLQGAPLEVDRRAGQAGVGGAAPEGERVVVPLHRRGRVAV